MSEDKYVTVEGKKFRCIADAGSSFKLVAVTEERNTQADSVDHSVSSCLSAVISGDDEEQTLQDSDSDEESSASMNGNSRKSLKKCRVTWEVNEVEKLLEICEDKHVIQKLDGKMGQNLTHKQIFSSVANALRASKYSVKDKDWNHCKTKFKKLAKEYRSVQRVNGKSGSGRVTMKHYDRCHQLFFRRPSVTSFASGFDSSSTDCHDSVIEDVCTEDATVDDPDETQDSLQSNSDARSTASNSNPMDSIPKVKPVQRYRRGNVTSAVQAIQTWIEQDRIDAKEERERAERSREEERRHDEKMVHEMTGAMSTIMASQMEMFAKIMQGCSQPQPFPVFMPPPAPAVYPQNQSAPPNAIQLTTPITRTPLNTSNANSSKPVVPGTVNQKKYIVIRKNP